MTIGPDQLISSSDWQATINQVTLVANAAAATANAALPTTGGALSGAVTLVPSVVSVPVAIQNLFGALVTPEVWGAKGDGQTYDDAAFTDYLAWFRAQVAANSGFCREFNLGHNKTYLLQQSLDWTGFNHVVFNCHGSSIIVGDTGHPQIDMSGSSTCWVNDLTLYGGFGGSWIPSCGIFVGRYQDATGAGEITLNNLDVFGFYGQACLQNLGSEDLTVTASGFRQDNPAAPIIIQDGVNHWPTNSRYMSGSLAYDTANSFNDNVFISCIFSRHVAGTVQDVWMSGGAHGHKYIGCYTLGANTNVAPACAIYFPSAVNDGGEVNQLHWDVHSETEPSHIFWITGPYATPVFNGLHAEDHYMQCYTSAFGADTHTTSVLLTDCALLWPEWYQPATAKMFDQPSRYRLSGRVAMNSAYAGCWNNPAFGGGDFFTDNAASFQSVLTGQWRLIGSSNGGAVETGNRNILGTLSIYNDTVGIGGDPVGAMGIGIPGGAGTPYLDFYGNSAAGSTKSARLIAQAVNQLALEGGTGAPTFNMSNGTIVGATIARSISAPLTATGTNQATALQLAQLINVFTVVPTGTGAILEAQPDEVIVYNDTADPLLLYPPLLAAILGLSVNSPYTINPYSARRFIQFNATTYLSLAA